MRNCGREGTRDRGGLENGATGIESIIHLSPWIDAISEALHEEHGDLDLPTGNLPLLLDLLTLGGDLGLYKG